MNKLEKARFYPQKDERKAFYVQFNPNTIQYRVGADLDRAKQGSENAIKQDDATGQSGKAELSMTLYFYSFRSETDYDDVRKKINVLRPYLGRREKHSYVMGEKLTFAWGTLALRGRLSAMEVSYQMFASDGTPVQAEARITMIGEDPEVKAEGINHAQSLKLEREKEAAWDEKQGGSDPAEDNPEIAWLFEGA